jgi:hypothetical protein
MSEQAPPQEETPAVVGPEGSQATAEEIDWQARAAAAEDRYGNLQPEYTRATQELAAYREREGWYDLLLTAEDADTRRQAAEALGLQLEEEEDQSDDPFAPVNQRLERIEQSLSQRDEREEATEDAMTLRQIFDARLADLGVDEEDGNWILAYALHALPAVYDQDFDRPLPDIQAAYEAFNTREDARQKAWAKSKRAPHISPNGQSGTEAPNLDNRQERVDFVLRRMQENEQAQ